jgi:hypothetical protein
MAALTMIDFKEAQPTGLDLFNIPPFKQPATKGTIRRSDEIHREELTHP